MPYKTFSIIFISVMVILIISVVFPYQRFNIADKYVKIIKIIVAIVVIGVAIRYLLYSF
jgi:hypothetical protein